MQNKQENTSELHKGDTGADFLFLFFTTTNASLDLVQCHVQKK